MHGLKRTFAMVAALALVAAACGGDETGTTTGPTGGEPNKGGEIVLGAEQWPGCINLVTTECAGLSWASYSVFEHITSKALEIDVDGETYIAGPLVTEVPSLENGGVTEDPFTVTYNLNPDAVWDDNTPITCDDWAFTQAAFVNTPGSYYTVGYDQIGSVDCPDPQTVVLNFKAVYADWQVLFGGAFDFVMKKAAFPDVDAAKPDVSAEMTDGVPFSSGPWILESWSPEEAVLVRNENYWVEDRVPLLDKVTMIPIIDQAAEINAVLNREVAAIYPQASDVSVAEQVASDPGVTVIGTDSPYFEMLWFIHDVPPMDDPVVREALLWAVDRQSVIDAIIKLNNPDAEVLNCAGYPPGPWCVDTFSDVTYDPATSISTLEADGWDCSGVPDAPCEKDGKPLVVKFSANTGNTRRETTQQLLKEAAKPAGFEIQIENAEADFYFGRMCPRGLTNVCDYASGGNPVGTILASFGCDYIPTKENQYGGGNWNHYCNPEADALMTELDQEIDPAKRLEISTQVQEIFRADAMSLPLYAFPQPGVWRSDTIAGPIGDYNAHIYGLFYNMYDWYLVE